MDLKQLKALEKLNPVKISAREKRLNRIAKKIGSNYDTGWIKIDNQLTDLDLKDRVSWLEGKDYERQQEIRRYFNA